MSQKRSQTGFSPLATWTYYYFSRKYTKIHCIIHDNYVSGFESLIEWWHISQTPTPNWRIKKNVTTPTTKVKNHMMKGSMFPDSCFRFSNQKRLAQSASCVYILTMSLKCQKLHPLKICIHIYIYIFIYFPEFLIMWANLYF